jgi:hypothetical protein
MKYVTYTGDEEPVRFTIFWKNGTSEVIRAFQDESFYAAFERSGFSQMCLVTAAGYVQGEQLDRYVFDNEKKIWLEKKTGNTVIFLSNLTSYYKQYPELSNGRIVMRRAYA